MTHGFALFGSALGGLCALLALFGILYLVVAAITFRRFFATARPVRARGEAVTLLKPLYGAEPRLYDNLATFLAQDHAGPVQLLCGVQRADDPAIAVVEALKAAHPAAEIDLVIDPAMHGASGKISNLINMQRAVRYPIVVLSDSDIAVAPDYLARLLAALDEEKVGMATCVYIGRGDAGFWSRLVAAGISYRFMLGVVFGVSNRLATPCMGSTIALRRETLERIGGFARFADVLADDYAIGEAVRALGLRVAVPPMIVTHACDEQTLGQQWRHELRWGATVRDVAFWPYVGVIVSLPLPLALLASIHLPVTGLLLAIAAVFARLMVVRNVDAAVGERIAPLWMALLHDGLGIVVYVASFFVRSVDWRGATLTMKTDGRIAAAATEQRV